MFCRKCGAPNRENAYKCTQCGDVLHAVVTESVESNLALAIAVTVLCCMPFGLVGIVYANQVNAKALAGDVAGAKKAAKDARTWSLLGLGFGAVVGVAYAAAVMLGAITGARP
jgi:hypothetical protein